MENSTNIPDGDAELQTNPHWVITIFSVIGYIVCTLMGSASSITSLGRMISQKKLWRSYWSTILLLTASVFVSLIVVPLEVTQMTMHYFNSSTYILCDVHFFSMTISQVLAFTCTLLIAVRRMRKIHSSFHANIQDLPERIAVIVSVILFFPTVGTLMYGSHTQKFIILPYQYCLRVQNSLLGDTDNANKTYLNYILPLTIITILVGLVCVYMKGVMHIKKRMTIQPSVSYPNMSLENMATKTISNRKLFKSLDSLRTDNFTGSCSELTTDTYFTKSDGELSFSRNLSLESKLKSDIKPVFLVPRESMSSTDYRNSTSSSFTYSSSPQSGAFQPFSNTDTSPRSSFASIETTSDMVPYKPTMRKSRKTQYSISKALKKVSTVSMLSIETIPESSSSLVEDSPQLLHPLRHTRRSAGNMWHQASENALEQKSHRSGNSKKGKHRKWARQNSQGSAESSSYSISAMTSDTDFQSNQIGHAAIQQLKRQSSRCSITSDATHTSICTADDGEPQNTDTDICEMLFSLDTHPIAELAENKTARIKDAKLSIASVGSLPSQQQQEQKKIPSYSQSVGSQDLGEDDKICDNVSIVDSQTFRQPLPPINSKHLENEDPQGLKKLDNSQVPLCNLIHTWGRSQASAKMFRRSQSLINFYANGPPVSGFKCYKAETPEKVQPIKTALVHQTTQTEELTYSSAEKPHEKEDILHVQSLESTSNVQQQRPMIRIIRPSLPHKAHPLEHSGGDRSRRVLRNNWCPPDLKRSTSVQFMEPSGARGSVDDRHFNEAHRGSIWSTRSAFLMNRYEMDIKRVFKRSCLLISAYLVCFLPTTLVYLTHLLLHDHALVNLYAFSRVLECSYFTAVPFLYVYTNASLMKLIHKKQK